MSLIEWSDNLSVLESDLLLGKHLNAKGVK